MRLAETIERWFGRVEITLAGLDDTLRAGEEALAAGDPMRARAAAYRESVFERKAAPEPDAVLPPG